MTLKQVKKLHNLVIHGIGGIDPKSLNGTDRQYYQETRQIRKITNNSKLLNVCRRCFKDPN